MLDISDTLAPKSDQLDAVDLLRPQVFTVAEVSKVTGEQPLNVRLVEFPRVWRPSKGMRRVLAFCWGKDAKQWAGRRVELFCDASVQYGGKAVGGIRISRMSHIDGAQKVPLLVAQGRGSIYTVEPLPDAPAPRDWRAEADALSDLDALRALWKAAPEDMREYIAARVTDVQAKSAPTTEA